MVHSICFVPEADISICTAWLYHDGEHGFECLCAWVSAYSSFSAVLNNFSFEYLILLVKRDFVHSPRPSSGCWKIFPPTAGEKACISWTRAHSDRISKTVLDHFAAVALTHWATEDSTTTLANIPFIFFAVVHPCTQEIETGTKGVSFTIHFFTWLVFHATLKNTEQKHRWTKVGWQHLSRDERNIV